MLKVDNFLIIFSLEVGGKFIGWFGVITNVIVLPLCLVFLIEICLDKDLKFIRDQLDFFVGTQMTKTKVASEEVTLELPGDDDENEKVIKHLREYLLASLILIAIISSIYLIASALLIRGTNNRNFRQISPAKNILAFLAFFSVLALLIRLSINSMINAVLYTYVFAVINSLWKMLRDEEETGHRVTDAQRFYPIETSPKV